MEFMVFATVVLAIYLALWFFDSFFKVNPKTICSKIAPHSQVNLINFENDRFLQSCMHYPYEAFLNGTGLTIKPFRIQWYTTALNRITIKWAHTYPRLFTISFDIGVFSSFFLLPVVLLWQMKPYIVDALQSMRSTGPTTPADSSNRNGGVQLELMLPGVNLPLDEISYYAIA